MDASGKYTKSAQHSKTFSLFAGAFSYFPTLLSHSSLQPLVIMDSSSLKHRQFELNTKPLSFYIWLYHFVNPPSLSTRLPLAHRIDPGRGHAGDGSIISQWASFLYHATVFLRITFGFLPRTCFGQFSGTHTAHADNYIIRADAVLYKTLRAIR